MTTTTFSCRVQYLDDTDPFSSTSNFPEPIRPECYTFYTNVLLENQIITLKGFLKAPHKIEEAALQLYWNNGAQSDFGIYLDLDSTLDEQADELEGFVENKKNAIILRTQLSIRVHTCTERLLSLNGRDLRKALFALKQIFQDDKDLVHAFVTNEGLDCLIRVGSDGDQSEQNAILKALGQVMLYVDGMNGVMAHNQTVQWLYQLLQSKTSVVVKTSLKLLILFVEYAETNTPLVLQAIRTVDVEQGTKPWSNIMAVLKDTNRGDLELLVYTMTLVNKMLNAIPDQDVFYDVTDAMEEQGMGNIMEHFMSRQGLDDDLLEQFKIYEAVLSHEDGEGELELFSRMDSIRKTPRIKSEAELRKSRRRSEAHVGTLSSAQSLSSLNNLTAEAEMSVKIRRGNIIDDSALLATSLKEPSFYPSGRDNINTKTEADIGDNNAKGILNRKQRRFRQKSLLHEQNYIIKSASMTNLADDTQSPPLSPHAVTTYDDTHPTNEQHLQLPYGLDNNKNRVKPPSDIGNKSKFSFLGQQKYRFGSPDLVGNRAVAPAVGVCESRELYGSYHPSAETGSRAFETEHDRRVEPASTIGECYPDYVGDFRSRLENPAVLRPFGADVAYGRAVEERRVSDSVYVKEPVVVLAEPIGLDHSISRGTLLDGPERVFPQPVQFSRDFPGPCHPEEFDYHGPSSAVVENDSVENGGNHRDLDDLLSQYRLSHSFDAADAAAAAAAAAEADGEMDRGRSVADLSSRLMHSSVQYWSPYPKDQADAPFPSRLPVLPEDSERVPGPDGFTAEIMGRRANLRPLVSSAVAPVVLKQPDAAVDEKTDLNWEKIRRAAKDRRLVIRDLDFTNLTDLDDVDYLGVQATATSRYQTSGGTHRYFPPVPSVIPPPPPPPMMGIPPPPSIAGIIPPPPPPPINVLSPQPQMSAGSHDASKKSKKTMKLHWKEAKVEFHTPTGKNLDTIWTKLSREVGHVGVNTTQLEHLFELKSQDGKGKDVVSQKQDGSRKELTILDTKRSNAINIGRTSLPGSTDTIKTAIMNMDTSILNREAIEKLLTTMMPTDEEKVKIFAALNSNSDDIPLGTAEQFLLAMGSIPELYSRLKLWLFKLDYETTEREISEPLSDLMTGIEELRKNATFKYILATLLSIGNFLNGSEANGFTIEYLSRVPDVKDTVHKHTLLHHLVSYVLDKFQDGTDLYSEVGAISRCAKLDWDELEEKLKNLEIDCKASWNHLNIISKHDLPVTLKNKLTEFLMECSTGIVLLQTVYARVMNRYTKFLLYLGYTVDAIREDKVHLFCKTISEFALEYRTTREKVIQLREKKANQRERKKTRGKMILDSMNSTKMLASRSKLVPTVIEEEEGDDLNKILQNGSGIFKSRKRVSNESTAKSTTVTKKDAAPDAFDTAEDELLESVLRNASATPAEQKPRERRRRARNTDRRSLRRTLKSGLTTEEVAAVNSKIL